MCLNDVMFYSYSYSEWPCRNSPHFSHLYMVIEKGHGQTWDLEIIHLLQDRQVKLVACVAGYTGSWEQSIKPDNFKHLFSLMLLGKRGSKSANFWGYLCFHRPLFYNDLELTPTFRFFETHGIYFTLLESLFLILYTSYAFGKLSLMWTYVTFKIWWKINGLNNLRYGGYCSMEIWYVYSM